MARPVFKGDYENVGGGIIADIGKTFQVILSFIHDITSQLVRITILNYHFNTRIARPQGINQKIQIKIIKSKKIVLIHKMEEILWRHEKLHKNNYAKEKEYLTIHRII